MVKSENIEKQGIPGIDFPLVLYDGYCNLCSGAVKLILKYEKNPDIYFISLQSPKVSKIAPKLILTDPPDSVLLIENGEIYEESTAALKIAAKLKFPFNPLQFLIHIPRLFRDPIYRFIADNRYSWFGKKDSCYVPNEQWKKRFLD